MHFLNDTTSYSAQSLPAIFDTRAFGAVSGLMSYGANVTERHRTAYTGRILKGEKPADLPVQQSTKVELIVNLKAVKTLSLTILPSLLLRAGEVIE